MNKARATSHTGKQGQGTAKHNFREFPEKTKEKGKSDINRNLTCNNQYYVSGRFFTNDTEMKNFFNRQTDFFTKQAFRFRGNEHYKDLTVSQKYELGVYEKLLDEGIKAQHRRNAANRQECLNKDALDIIQATRTQPEESILQIGNKDNCPVSAGQLWEIYKDYVKLHNAKFGKHIIIMDAVLHTDETTPHIHIRTAYIGTNKHGEPCISKNSALGLLGINRPDLSKPQNRYNNSKQTYSAMCRNMWIAVCRQHGLELETEPKVYGDKHGLELTEYKVQREQQKLDKIIMAQTQADKELRRASDNIKGKQEVLEFIGHAVNKATADKDSLQKECARLRQDKDNLQSQIFMQEQDITEQKKTIGRNTRVIHGQEQAIADYKENWQDTDIAMYVSRTVQMESPDYYNGIIESYWQDMQAWEQEQQTDMEITM